MIRKVLSKLSRFSAKRAAPFRRSVQAPIKVSFAPHITPGIHTSSIDNSFLSGETTDMSRCGIGFVVSAIRIKENYLVGHDRKLIAEIELPNGKVKMTVLGKRYEKVGLHLSTERFMIGAEVIEMSAHDREVFEHFIKFGPTKQKAGKESFESI
jgi:hypothetical protein